MFSFRSTGFFLLCLLILTPTMAWAGPEEYREDEWHSCMDDEGGCTSLCGASYSEDGQHVTWGALNYDINNMEAQQLGLALYCQGSGGVVLATASAAGVQSYALRSVFTAMEKRNRGAPRREMGAVFEVNDVGPYSIVGTSIPASWTINIDRLSDIDLQGNLIIGGGGGIMQYGFNINPVYSRYVFGADNEQGWQIVAGASLPMQFVGTSGTGLDFGVSWLIGAGGMVGISRPIGSGAIGLGATLDLRYASGLTLPLHIAFRSSHDLRTIHPLLGHAVVQPGVSLDFAAGGNIDTSVRVTMLVGLDIRNWVVGYQTYIQGGSSSHGFGLTYIGKSGELASGGGAYTRDDEEEAVPIKPPEPKITIHPARQVDQPATQPAASDPGTPAPPETPVPPHAPDAPGDTGASGPPPAPGEPDSPEAPRAPTTQPGNTDRPSIPATQPKEDKPLKIDLVP